MATKYVKGKLYKLAIADLQPDPNQARSFMEPNALNELATDLSGIRNKADELLADMAQ